MIGLLDRAGLFVRRYGVWAAFSRVVLEIRRRWAGRWMVLYSCDLQKIGDCRVPVSANGEVERKRTESEVTRGDWIRLLESSNSTEFEAKTKERFAQGASLWLYRIDRRVAGFGWTISDHTMQPHYFPFSYRDVHLFDFFVFPEYRGKGVNPALVCSILDQVSQAGMVRAFIEVWNWNRSQLTSLSRTPFVVLGEAKKTTLFNRSIVLWRGNWRYSKRQEGK